MDHITARIRFLASLVQALRGGVVFEVSGDAGPGRIAWAATRFRLARDRRIADSDIELQIQTETRTRSGRTALLPWSFCDWTINGLAELLDNTGGDAVSTVLAPAVPGDPIVDLILQLANGETVRLAGRDYLIDDDAVSADDHGHLIAPNSVHHRADDWICIDLSFAQLAEIPGA